MTAKEYLKEIEKFDVCIDQKQMQLDSMRAGRCYIRGMDYSAERVQTTHEPGNQTKQSDRMCDLEREIDDDIDSFHEMKNERIKQMQSLSNVNYIKILHRCYIQYMSLEEIAVDLGYAYNYVSTLHGEGLKEFEIKFLTFLKTD